MIDFINPLVKRDLIMADFDILKGDLKIHLNKNA